MTAADELPFVDALMDAESFGRRLRELRVATGLSQLALAERAGINRTNIVLWEKGERTPVATTLPALAAALGVPVEALFADPAADVPAPKRGRPGKAKPADAGDD